MKIFPVRRIRRLVPSMTQLETRRLLTADVISLGQDGHDIVGPDASQGPDGIQDLHLQLANLSGSVSSISVQAAGGFAWATEPDASGYALAEFFASATAGQGDLYLNPQIRSDLSPTGGALPLGGSTGNLVGLANGSVLTLTIDYQGQISPGVVSISVSHLVSATDPMPALPTPVNVISGFAISDLGQDGTGNEFENGFVHLVATAPAGITLTPTTFAEIGWELTDSAGESWDNTTGSLGHGHIYATLRPGTDNIADFYFPPLRDEAPQSNSTAATMTLTAMLPGDSTPYVTSFAGANWNLTLLTEAMNGKTPPTVPMNEAALRADLTSESPEYDIIELPADETIVITQPIEIPHSVTIIGNGATLLFDQGDSPAWPASAAGAIYVANPAYTNIQLTMEDFTIRFDTSAPIRWSNPNGDQPPLWDPEDNPNGITHAVVDLYDLNDNRNREILTLSGMTIDGPPAFDASTFSTIQSQLLSSSGSYYMYSGESAISLIRSNVADSGYLTDSTFQGGPIELFGGPWTVTDNTILGAMTDTFSAGAFALHSAHDVLLEQNVVTQSKPDGTEFRLVVLAVSGVDDTLIGNSFGGGAGSVGNELTYDASTDQFMGINDPEIILAESSASVLFEGRPSAVSADGRLLVLADLRVPAGLNQTGPGLIVSILSGVAADGSPDNTEAGEWFPVAQQVSLTSDGTIELLMQDALPAAPPGGYFVIEVSNGFVNTSFIDNTINMAGKSSTGIKLDGADFGTTITGNSFVGSTIYDDGYTGTAIRLGAAISSSASGSGSFPLPAGWTVMPSLGTTITGNTIVDSLGGIDIGLEDEINYWAAQVDSNSEAGRLFLTAVVSDNAFSYDSQFLTSWQSAYIADGNDPSQSSMPPSITIGAGFSAEAPGPNGSPRFPWTVGGADTVNGSDQAIFVDPITNQVLMSGNTVETLSSLNVSTVLSGALGQAYAGVIDGIVFAPRLAAETYDGQPYNPFNLENLNIDNPAESVTVPPTPISPPTPTPTPNPSPSPTPSPSPISTPTPTPSPSPSPTPKPTPSPTPTPAPIPTPKPTPSPPPRKTLTSSPTTVPAMDKISVKPVTVDAIRRLSQTVTVVTFTDSNTHVSAQSFAVRIRWGDGRVSTASVTGSDGIFQVNGRHAYLVTGRFTVKVRIERSALKSSAVSATTAANVFASAVVRAARLAKLAKHSAAIVYREAGPRSH